MNDLKPCPFCGGKPQFLTSSDGFTSIGCLRCNPIFGIMVQRMSKEEALDRWNTRHERTCRPILKKLGIRVVILCSECGSKIEPYGDKAMKYCPCCGAKVVE